MPKSKTLPIQDIFSMAFCGIWNFPSRSQRDLQTSVIIFQSRSAERSLIKTRLLTPAGRLLSSGDVRRTPSSVCLRLPRFHPVGRVLPLRPFGCLRKFSSALRCRVCSAWSGFVLLLSTTLSASASCSTLVLRFAFVCLHRFASLHAHSSQ